MKLASQYAFPSKCCRISHPFLRFGRIKGISPSAEGNKGLCPLDPRKPLEKA
ncbi:MAG: hypothetical protein ACI4J0_10310 [Huintestinicola sp.]|uniref:hypothetical protein n=1 Tax=Huintestinicola sp. TaxID=2981661 RepID=UPI003F000B75